MRPELLCHDHHVTGDDIDARTQEALQVRPFKDVLVSERRRRHSDQFSGLHLEQRHGVIIPSGNRASRH
jgi:hypothetical protein